MSNNITILDKIAVVMIPVTLWSGQKKLEKEDLADIVATSALPDSDVAHLGQLKVVDSQDIAWGQKFKARMIRTCLGRGTRFLGGYAIPADKIDDVTKVLDGIVAEANAAKAEFMAAYVDKANKHIAAHPNWERALRRVFTPASEVSYQYKFTYSIVNITPASQSGHLKEEILDLGKGVLKEIATEMKQFYKVSLLGKSDISRKTFNPLKDVRTKLEGLSFLDAAFRPMIEKIDRLLDQVPEKGAVASDLYNQLVAMVLILSDPDEVRNHGQGLIAVSNTADALAAAAQVQQPTQPDVPVIVAPTEFVPAPQEPIAEVVAMPQSVIDAVPAVANSVPETVIEPKTPAIAPAIPPAHVISQVVPQGAMVTFNF